MEEICSLVEVDVTKKVIVYTLLVLRAYANSGYQPTFLLPHGFGYKANAQHYTTLFFCLGMQSLVSGPVCSSMNVQRTAERTSHC